MYLEEFGRYMQDKINKMVHAFAASVIAQNESLAQKAVKSGNKFAMKYHSAAKSLIDAGDKGIIEFSKLLADRRVAVRCMAAAYLIPFRTDECMDILEDASSDMSVIGLGAKIAIERWKKEGVGITI